MTKVTFAALPLLAALALPPGEAIARPPEGPSGKMVFDEVADALRKYRKEKDPQKQAARLTRLAAIRDPRVALALGEAFTQDNPQELCLAGIRAVVTYYARLPPEQRSDNVHAFVYARAWWKDNEADLRRRAARLPR
jgi:hypothetical protein